MWAPTDTPTPNLSWKGMGEVEEPTEVKEREKEKYLDGNEFLYIYTWQLQSGFLM